MRGSSKSNSPRAYLMVAGTAGATGLTGLPGCTLLNGGDGGDGGPGVATIAVTAPKWGQLSSLGKSVEQGYQLGGCR